ncbi:hypothetical protein PVAP13_4NG089217 [Panicum virgatum]|uniref:DFDF domain-containing protein n=1 Tax=Panicum virgatum TaxID=38727 RepID=A0A8T0T8S8_PANVG|nr:hypothetical protein PVAP13_4NG089217 [Panicum virgatum]
MAAAAGAPESYIGSVISLTSKSEIRYEGVLYTINTEESSIGLRKLGFKHGVCLEPRHFQKTVQQLKFVSLILEDTKSFSCRRGLLAFVFPQFHDLFNYSFPGVRSFGTEGRKKDGQQIPASDKIYEYILFRGSDIKDLQSHYPRPVSSSTSLPPAASTTSADTTSHNAPSAIQMPPPFQGNLPPFQPGANLQSWNSSPMPASANGAGLTMPPMYWPGYYTPPTGFPHLQPPPFLRPPHSLTVPQALQPPVHYPGLNGSLPAGFPSIPELPSFLQPGNSNSLSQSLGVSTSVSAPASSSTSVTESSGNQLPNKLSSISASVFSVGLTPPSVSPSISTVEPSMLVSLGMPSLVNTKPVALPDSTVPSLSSDKPVSVPAAPQVTLVTPGRLLPTASSTVTPSQALQTASATVPSSKVASTVPSSQATSSVVPSSQVTSSTASPLKAASSSVLSEEVQVIGENKAVKQREWKAKQPALSRPITKFTEDFDFMAMNEKFNKDEVWGHLGKSTGQLNDDPNDYEDVVEDEISPRKPEAKPVYVKDDFFDSLTFGDSARHRPMGMRGGRAPRGGGGPHGGGPRGRGYYGGGYGYMGRGHGYSYPNHQS